MENQKIGNFIKELRKEKKLTQKDLAAKLMITDRAVSKWERGLNCPDISLLDDYILLPSFEEIKNDKYKYAKSFKAQHDNIDAITAKMLIEPYDGWYVVQNTPALPLSREEMDFTYGLHFERTFHPSYHYIPAIEEVQFSITSNRGCFGSCAFCAITHHQGRTISSRSEQSIVDEAIKITQMPNFKG